ncbi:hypothetical protein PCE1_000154 [Barthelona sp. PCE]
MVSSSVIVEREEYGPTVVINEHEKKLGKSQILAVYVGYCFLLIFGHIAELFSRLVIKKQHRGRLWVESSESFYRRRFYSRTADRFNTPIFSMPGTWVSAKTQMVNPLLGNVMQKTKPVTLLNLGSYNYLDLVGNEKCVQSSMETLLDVGVSPCMYYGSSFLKTKEVYQLEQKVANFVGKESAIVCGQGFATNSGLLTALFQEKDLLLSDSLNHASLVCGMRRSAAKIECFEHNNFEQLERLLRAGILSCRYQRIWVIVEGIYSMEGEILQLPAFMALKEKYKFFLFIDEAHSIGSLGSNGRGVCEYHGVDPSNVEVLMGTFTKSFGSVGGYVAADASLIDYISYHGEATTQCPVMSSVSARQAYEAFCFLETSAGKERIACAVRNANYFRSELEERGFFCIGSRDSLVVPVMLYHPGKIAAFGREAMKRGLACVTVGYPAVPLLLGRVRFCLSAGHTMDELKWCIERIDEVGELCDIKYGLKGARV